MKKFLYAFAIIGLAFTLAQCTAKKLSAEKKAKYDTEKIFTAAKLRWPETKMSDIDSGRVIFLTKCSKCHATRPIASRTEASWLTTINKMAPRARLKPEQKVIITHFILAARDAGVK